MRRALVLCLVIACGKNTSAPLDAPGQDAAIDAYVDPPDAPMLPVFRNPVSLPDDQLALQALQLLGANVQGAVAKCGGCHGLTREHLLYWRQLSDTAMSSCLTDLSVTSQASALQMINCLRSMPATPTSDFDITKAGVFASAAKLPWFRYAFWVAYGSEGSQLADFQAHVGEPRSGFSSFTQGQFDIVAEWFARGLPKLNETLPPDGQPTECDPSIGPEVAAHVSALSTTGWRQVNLDNSMAMFGCGTQTDPKLCLSTTPLGADQPYGTTWDATGRGRLRVLKDVTYSSSYWTRSSPDGRFMAHGVSGISGSYVIDLQRNVLVPIATAYDPGFFPDGTGFVFQGGPRNACGISVLTSDPASITMTEPACSNLTQIGLYQHVGRALGGGDYFAIDSEFVSDDGGHSLTNSDPAAYFGSEAVADFIPMIFDGTKYQSRPEVTISTPYEGDSVLSPSTTIMISRVSDPNSNQLGYVMRAVNKTQVGTSYQITTPQIARYCVSGGKPAFSYDERWLVYHHYITPTDADAVELGFANAQAAGFQPYVTLGASNIYLMELSTGISVRLTNMNAGQYALFPHFRSDGWIYADVRDTVANHEYMVASDGALLAE